MTPAGPTRTVVIVGNGMVGHRLVEAICDRGLLEQLKVIVLGGETRAAYDRVALSSYVDTRDASTLALDKTDVYARVELRLGCWVTSIDREAHTVICSDGSTVAYDTLVLATGSKPFVPPMPGHDAEGCFVYRTIEDLDAIIEAAATTTTGIVIGGGLLGLEAANALRSLGVQTHVVEMAPRLMPLQVDEGGGAVLRRHIENLGVKIHLGAQTREVALDADGRVRGLVFADDSIIESPLVVFSAGIRPQDELARAAGFEMGPRGGVVVDRSCQTSDADIYAIGEVACVGGIVYGLVGPGYAQAEVVADRLAGGVAEFADADTSTKLKLLGVDVASFGDAMATTEGALEVVFADHVSGVYKKLVVTDDASLLLGGVLVGDASAYAVLRPMVSSGSELTVDPEQFLLPAQSGATPVGGANLPGSAIVCSCHNITAETIRAAVSTHGCEDVPAIKGCTKAGTGCGSCVPLINGLLADELKAAGKEVSRALCEHFAMSRQELFDVIRVQRIASFTELVRRHGTGRGCSICKPAVASILASLTNKHPLAREAAGLQDSNDHVLANLQRDGSYSVVPRIPGGEITPEGLISIGEVARDFGLYTKITGGQRIDLFGARIDQLPLIWGRLVDAGFESGHAYGKSLRTVKSCVGSTWCRYGVQDAVGMAILLELRYRGLRAPHKLKSAVSGCARECAEARGKDFGIIATELGWNLYVGGNGGFTPRHAELLAADLDDATLIRYIDRFLMYYIRTADRLQRTATWIESIEGGLEHVRDVVVEDSLGLGAELEAEMARHVDTYSDEWKATLEDPEKLARFASFVNAPGTPDPSIVFVPVRDQHRPATADERATLIAPSRLPVGVP